MLGFGSGAGSVLTVIPCLDEAPNLPGLIEWLLKDPANQLIVVADGGSTDGSREIVTEMSKADSRVVLLDNPDRIQSAGVNRAVERFGAGRAWLARIDAHCEYPEDFVSRLVEAAKKADAGSVVVPMLTIGERGFVAGVAAAQNSRLGNGGAPHRMIGTGRYVDHGHHALIRLADFRKAGGYCELMPRNEDAELDIRLARIGTKIWLEPSALIAYHPRRTPRALLRQYYHYGLGRAATKIRHRKRLRLRQLLPLAIAPAVGIAAAAPIWPWAAVPALSWLLLCQAWGMVLAARERRPGVLLAGSAAMIMHLGWSAGFWKKYLSSMRSKNDDTWQRSLPFRTATSDNPVALLRTAQVSGAPPAPCRSDRASQATR